MRRPIVAGNWKLNGSRQSVKSLVDGIQSGLSEVTRAEVVVCPTFVHLGEVGEAIQGSPIRLGAQDVSDQDEGAFTGEVAAPMLKEYGCEYVIVGHSERRNVFGEGDEFTAKKFAAVRRAGLTPILCVGELLEERESGQTEEVVARQLDAVIELEGVGAFADAVIAYEPVWAIGTGKTATPDQAQAVHQFIRAKVAALDAEVGDNVQILYGGSVKGSNASELFAMADIDGGLIGGAALKSEEFLTICRGAN
jgi:triosephosphate isomerase